MKPEPTAEYFKNRKEAHSWLVSEGFKISTGKFYEDIKKNGFPVLSSDGSVSKYQVMVYGRSLEGNQAADPSALDRSEYMHRKDKADAELAEMKAERMRREEDKNWLHAEDAWAVVAGLVGTLRDTVRRYIHSGQVEITLAAGGKATRAPEVFEHIDGVVNKAFNEVAGKKINITFTKNED